MSTVVAKNLTVQNSAGTSSTNISFDGTKLVSTQPFDGLGVGQTWQDVTASRAAGVTYTNSTGKPIVANISFTSLDTTLKRFVFFVNGLDVATTTEADSTARQFFEMELLVIIPHGATYNANRIGSGNFSLASWRELR